MYEDCTLFDRLKTCTACGDALPATTDYFYANKQVRGGLRGKCKDCYNAHARKWHWDNRDIVLERQRLYREEHPERVSESRRRYLEANPEKRAESVQRYLKSHAAERVVYNREYRAKNPAKTRAWKALRRIREQNGQADPVDYEAILERYGMVCHICGSVIERPKDLNMDHVVPLARGGIHAESNIRPSHARCNFRKGAKLLEELDRG